MSWREPALIPTKYYENKTVWVVFQATLHGTVKISRNIARKSKNEEILKFLKNRFLKNTFLTSPADPTDRPIGWPTDPEKKTGGSGGVLPPSKKHFF